MSDHELHGLPRVRFIVADGEATDVFAGGIIGRSPMAALIVEDPRVSEAHALVSLRAGRLVLLPLRRRFAVGGVSPEALELIEGQVIDLAPGLTLEVLSVHVPDSVPVLVGDGLPEVVVPGVASLSVRPDGTIELVPRWTADADAVVWMTRDGVRVRVPGEADRLLSPGDPAASFAIRGHELRVLSRSLHASPLATLSTSEPQGALRIIARYDTVHLQRDNRVLLVLDGVLARVVSELVAMRVPVPWLTLANEVWGHGEDPAVLRRRFDVSLSRLRKRLREQRVRADLVRTNRVGHIELFLLPDDRIEDET